MAPSLRVRRRGDFSGVTLLLRQGNFLPTYWKLHTVAEKRRKKRWSGADSKTASYICTCFASCACTRCHRLRVRVRDAILREWVHAINIPHRHIQVSLVPRSLFHSYICAWVWVLRLNYTWVILQLYLIL